MADIRSHGAFLFGTSENDNLTGYNAPGFPGDQGRAQLLFGFDYESLSLYGLTLTHPVESLYTETAAEIFDGDDFILGGLGDDTLFGGGGNDTLSGGGSSFYGNNDILFGGWGDDLLIGGNAAQTSDGGADRLYGGPGNDVLFGMDGPNHLNGGSGIDIAIYALPRSAYTVEYDQSSGQWRIGIGAARDTVVDVEFALFDAPTAPSIAEAKVLLAKYADNPASVPNLLPLVADDLFTAGSDEVDFNKLDDKQKIAVTNGAELYVALGGNDKVTLPDGRTLSDGTVFATSLSRPFDAGAGNDTIQGGRLDDYVYGGADDDTFYSSPGKDNLRGGDGADTFDYRGGSFADFKDFGSDARQLLDGGSNPSAKLDVLELPEGEYRFKVVPAKTWQQTKTAVEKLGPDGKTVEVSLETMEIEKARIANPFVNKVSIENTGSAMAELMIKAYGTGGDVGRNWRPLSAMELGIKPQDDTRLVEYKFTNGLYVARSAELPDPVDPRPKSEPWNANALVFIGEVGGKKTLTIGFRGTDHVNDIPDYFTFSKHYDKFRPLIDGLKTWAQEIGVQKVLVTGHSLGAAMAQRFAADFHVGELQAYTFGTPGANNAAAIRGSQVNLIHHNDPVWKLGAAGLNKRAGSDVWINPSDLAVGDVDSLPAMHYAANYKNSFANLLIMARDASSPFFSHALAKAMTAGNIYAGRSVSISLGSDLDDVIKALRNDDFVLGGNGNDAIRLEAHTVIAGLSARVIDGGSGKQDKLVLPYTSKIFQLPVGEGGKLFFTRDGEPKLVATLHRIEEIYFEGDRKLFRLDEKTGQFRPIQPQRPEAGATTLTVESTKRYADAGDGPLKVIGSAGSDVILAGAGSKTIEAGGGNDQIFVSARATNADVIRIAGGAGADLMAGGASRTTYIVDHRQDAIIEKPGGGLDLVLSSVSYVLPANVENLTLTGSADIQAGGNGRANVLRGNGGDNTLSGGGGNDRLQGGQGKDVLDGGAGRDTADYSEKVASVIAALKGSQDTVVKVGRVVEDTIRNIESLTGGKASDRLTGDGAGNTLTGLGGNDILRGLRGNDILVGGAGKDTLYGGGGNDKLTGGTGLDLLLGGSGADVFIFRTAAEAGTGKARDVIRDFESGIDKIDLRDIDANTKMSGDQAFKFIGGTAFSMKEGELRFKNGIVSGDIDGDGRTDFMIEISNSSSLKEADFLL